jgi:addiction module HigA family antidote
LNQTNFDDVAGPERLEPVTPGEVLRHEFMEPLNLSARALAREIDVPPNRITGILNAERGITAGTAIMLGKRFNNSAQFWMNLQVAYDLAVAQRDMEAA